MRTDVNPKDPTHSKDTAVQAGGTKNRLNVETHLKHISELLLSGFGGELSKPTRMNENETTDVDTTEQT